MTVSSTTSRKTYTGNAATTSFDTNPVVFFLTSDLLVYVVTTATGAATLLTENTHYTVSGGSGSTGTVSLAGGISPYGAPSALQTLVIVRSVPETQLVDFVNNEATDAEVAEDALDKLTMVCQQLDTSIGRSAALADSDVSGADVTLPTPVAGAILGWDDDGLALQNYSTSDIGADIAVSSFMETVLDDSSAANARTTLGAAASVVTTKGDVYVGGAAGAEARLAVGANGTVPMARSAATPGLAYVAALNKAIYGFTYANAAGDVTNDIDIAAGGAMDATGAYWITGAASTKQLDAAWAVGSGAGGLDTGSIGNSDYYLWTIARSDTGVVDYLFSLSSTAPTMPTGYDFKRLIGWFKRVGAAIVAFTTTETEGGGLWLNWTAPTHDVNLANTLTTSRRTDAVKVPLNFSVEADITVNGLDASTGWAARVCCPDETDAAPVVATACLPNIIGPSGQNAVIQLRVKTSAAGLIAARASLATVDQYSVTTTGFRWSRR